MRARKSSVQKPIVLAKKQDTEVSLVAASASLTAETANAQASATVVQESNLTTSLLKASVKHESTTVPAGEIDSPTFVPEEDGYRCPVEDCRKLFRRDNLLGVSKKIEIRF